MKKTFLYLVFAFVTIMSCREDVVEVVPEVSIETQNSYDDQAAQLFLKTHAFDDKGKLILYKESDTTHVKLSDLDYKTLPSGVIYIVRSGAQPIPGEEIGQYDLLSIIQDTNTYIATDLEGKVAYTSFYPFRNNIDGSGVPETDPAYFYAKKALLNRVGISDVAKQRSFYEIEGFQEGLKFFKAYNIPDESNYNLQGIIIVPSRAAYARDSNYFDGSGLYRNRSFVFNFQIYKATHFTEPR